MIKEQWVTKLAFCDVPEGFLTTYVSFLMSLTWAVGEAETANLPY